MLYGKMVLNKNVRHRDGHNRDMNGISTKSGHATDQEEMPKSGEGNSRGTVS